MIDVIIFSKDRACQLDALFRSMSRNFHIDHRVTVIARATTAEFRKGYAELGPLLIRWVWETNFNLNLQTVLGTASPYILFLVDDVIITHPIEDDDVFTRFREDKNILTLSWRLGYNITSSQILGKDVRNPSFIGPLCVWNWKGQDDSWNYPMSLDGHLYRREDIVPYIKNLSFESPNRLEALMAESPLPQPHMICPHQSKLVGFCLNRVQDVYQNRCGDISAESLNEKWLGGQRIALDPIMGKTFNSLHVTGPITFEER